MEIEDITTPNGVTVKAALIHSSESCYQNDFIRTYEDVYYAQNRIFLKAYEVEYCPSEDGGWEAVPRNSPKITVLCDYAVIPELDDKLSLEA